jgi:ABC-type transport system involved in Fe-S cluster assembly, permease component
MENFTEKLKTRLKNAAYDYRQDCFLDFLKTPRRSFKESPVTKDYVDITEAEMERMATSIRKSDKSVSIESEADMLCFDGTILRSKEIPGVSIMNMENSINDVPDFLWKYRGKDREELLINASWSTGYFIDIKGDQDICITVDAYNSIESGAEKNVVIVGNNSRVKIIENRLNHGKEEGNPTQGKNLYIYLGSGATLEYNYLQDKKTSVNDITFIKTFQERDSTFKIFHVNHGSGKLLFVNESIQNGNNSDYRVFGATFSDGKQAIDVRDSSFQLGTATSADIQVRGIVSGKSSTIHRGNVDIELPSVNSTGFYDSKILLLSKDGYANSKPGLVIRNNNTRSKHGSSISNVDKEQILYLESRGIDHDTSVNLITGGFIESILEKSNNQKFIDTVGRYARDLKI